MQIRTLHNLQYFQKLLCLVIFTENVQSQTMQTIETTDLHC